MVAICCFTACFLPGIKFVFFVPGEKFLVEKKVRR